MDGNMLNISCICMFNRAHHLRQKKIFQTRSSVDRGEYEDRAVETEGNWGGSCVLTNVATVGQSLCAYTLTVYGLFTRSKYHINSAYSVYEELDCTTLEGDLFLFCRVLVYAMCEIINCRSRNQFLFFRLLSRFYPQAFQRAIF